MESLISVIDQLRTAFSSISTTVAFPLPQIVVIGSQSAGKSSVLECIVGRDFLPRGSGIVTRVPLILRLCQLPSSSREEWGEFDHLPGKKISNFEEIRTEIIRQTNVLAGPEAIANKPIQLSLFSSHHVDLTLVDLPGLVMNATAGQPKDIDVQIFNMVNTYISSPNTIILAICPANTDIATSQALRLSREKDPNGERTVGVITKIDLMDKGTDCLKILQNQEYPLTHGFVGVVCRSQQSINDRVSMEVAKKEERIFFSKSPVYSSVAEQCGIDYLRKKLNLLLMNHIRATIPELKRRLDEMHQKNQKMMESLGMLDSTNLDPGAQTLTGIKAFCDDVQKCINGGVSSLENEVVGGARIQAVLVVWFSNQIKSISLSNKLTNDLIFTNMRNMAGIHSAVFPSDAVIFSLVKTNVLALTAPCLSCITVIINEMEKIVASSADNVIRFANLKREIIRISMDLLQECSKNVCRHVETVIKAESQYINPHNTQIESLTEELFGKGSSKAVPEEAKEATSDNDVASSPSKSEPKDNKNREKEDKGKEREREKERESEREKEKERKKERKRQLRANNGSFGNPFERQHDVPDGNMKSIPSRMLMDSSSSSTNERRSFDVIRKMVTIFFDVAKENIADQVGKAILFLVVSFFCEEIYSRLIRELYSHEKIGYLVEEPPEQAEKRARAKEIADAIMKGRKALNGVNFSVA